MIKEELKRFWNWMWNSEPKDGITQYILSFIVLIFFLVIVIRLILFPLVGLIFHTSLPLAIVESSSMDHQITRSDIGRLTLCSQSFEKKQSIDFEEYWSICSQWYKDNTNISKYQMENFIFSNGFKKGDLMIISGWSDIKVGDVIVFSSSTKHPIIHRVISLDPLETKGDHNPGQLEIEKNIKEDQILGKAIIRVPYIGWPKVALCEAISIPMIC